MEDLSKQFLSVCGIPGLTNVVVDRSEDPEDDSKTILDYFEENVQDLGDQTFLTQPMGNDEILTWTYSDVFEEAKKVAGYIESLNLPVRSQIAICSKNCAWWVIADLGIYMSNNVSVPVFPTLTAETTKYTLEHSESKLLFVGKLDEKPWEEQRQGIPDGLSTVSFPLCPENAAEKTWKDTVTVAEPIENPTKPTPETMATIIYTSGSTGMPKGVMTSFFAMTKATKGMIKTLKITSEDRYLSYLPIAHGMERWAGECVPLYSGEQVFYAESLKTFADDLNRAKPTLFVSVPRLWTKFQAGVFQKLPEEKLSTLLSIPLVNILVRRKIISALGLDFCRFAASGSAPIPPELIEWYRSLGLELLEGYGMTENFNYSHFSLPGRTRAGYVGEVYSDAEQRIAEDGEIQMKTPGMMMGYFKNEKATKETITADGWVRTGDKGEIDEEGRLKITGRTKEIFKTSKGKYVAPAPIENMLLSNSLVELACIGGRGQPQPHAILQLSEADKKKAAEGNDSRAEIAKKLEVYLEKTVNSSLDGHEKLDFIAIVADDWLPENGFLTPTQKIKRAKIEEEYSSEVEGWYGQKEKVIWYGW